VQIGILIIFNSTTHLREVNSVPECLHAVRSFIALYIAISFSSV
jgi:hypothetical protein